jgi:putative RNA 2'-phosphotransferase
MNEVSVSKLLSLGLRHKPAELGLVLTSQGWAKVPDVLSGMSSKLGSFSQEDLEKIVETNSKKRFEFNEDKSMIRACQGHSVSVDLELQAAVPPSKLYHGTITNHLQSIMEQGLKPMSRHAVHLSKDLKTAQVVANRWKKAVVILEVDAAAMHKEGIEFKVSTNGVWLVSEVPSQYLKILAD